jgi:hypothetical protein
MLNYSEIRRNNPQTCGMEIFDIKPVVIGGDPHDPDNKTLLTRSQHIEAVRYWNPHSAGRVKLFFFYWRWVQVRTTLG